MLVPPARVNETAHVILGEMLSRTAKLKEKIEAGAIEENNEGRLVCPLREQPC